MAPARKRPAVESSKSSSSKDKDKGSTSKQQENISESVSPLRDIPLNVVKQFDLFQRNGLRGSFIKRSGQNIVCQRLNNFSMFKILNVFDRRVTCISWHPSKLLFMAGSKGGDMSLFNYSVAGDTFLERFQWPGPGPGLSILSIHYPRHLENNFLSTSIDGTVKLWHFDDTSVKPIKTLMSTGTIKRWFCSVTSCTENNVILVGDSKGNLISIDDNFKIISTNCIHKSKVNTVEFSREGGWTFATSSTDQTVKLFDLRNLKKEIKILEHNKSVNSAYFSSINSGRLLTTDQDCELRVYKGPLWELERTIRHPHRHFQHLTQIKATWHPLTDLIVVGRYPDNSKPDLRHMTLRTVDIYSAETGQLTNELYSANCSGILSLNEFSSGGDFLASAMGLYIPVWRASQSSLKHKLSPLAESAEPDNDLAPPKNKKLKKGENSKSGKSKS